jgi:hypothetical protein
MKKVGIAAIVASGLGAAVISLAAPAYAAPQGNGGSQHTVPQLQAPGSGTPQPGDESVKRINNRVAYMVFS